MNLLPCPFCGGRASQQASHQDSDELVIRCVDCCAEMPDNYIRGSDVKRWNTRTPPPTVWHRASEKLPTEADGDYAGTVWVSINGSPVERASIHQTLTWNEDWVNVLWAVTNFTKPKPPEV